jgi:hypothetical protein
LELMLGLMIRQLRRFRQLISGKLEALLVSMASEMTCPSWPLIRSTPRGGA